MFCAFSRWFRMYIISPARLNTKIGASKYSPEGIRTYYTSKLGIYHDLSVLKGGSSSRAVLSLSRSLKPMNSFL